MKNIKVTEAAEIAAARVGITAEEWLELVNGEYADQYQGHFTAENIPAELHYSIASEETRAVWDRVMSICEEIMPADAGYGDTFVEETGDYLDAFGLMHWYGCLENGITNCEDALKDSCECEMCGGYEFEHSEGFSQEIKEEFYAAKAAFEAIYGR